VNVNKKHLINSNLWSRGSECAIDKGRQLASFFRLFALQPTQTFELAFLILSLESSLRIQEIAVWILELTGTDAAPISWVDPVRVFWIFGTEHSSPFFVDFTFCAWRGELQIGCQIWLPQALCHLSQQRFSVEEVNVIYKNGGRAFDDLCFYPQASFAKLSNSVFLKFLGCNILLGVLIFWCISSKNLIKRIFLKAWVNSKRGPKWELEIKQVFKNRLNSFHRPSLPQSRPKKIKKIPLIHGRLNVQTERTHIIGSIQRFWRTVKSNLKRSWNSSTKSIIKS
jgi:hypothetical protein